MDQRQLSGLDRRIAAIDGWLRRFAPPARGSGRPNPAADLPREALDESARRHAAGLMRVNHAGEIAAQALYRGQAAVAANLRTREHLLRAAVEEQDHLNWCRERLRELGDGPSRLGPFWYVASWLIGAAAGLAGDRYSLGFVEETERQVVAHLEGHLQRLPAEDRRSRAIVARMRDDEARHGADAREAGAAALPPTVRALMRAVARVMTSTAYRI